MVKNHLLKENFKYLKLYNKKMPNIDEIEKILTFQIKFKGDLQEEFEIRKAVENFVLQLKLNVFCYKARVLTRKEIENLK